MMTSRTLLKGTVDVISSDDPRVKSGMSDSQKPLFK